MTNRRQRIHSELAESRAYLLSIAQQIGPDQVLASSENPAWNVHDLLAHLAVAERGLQGIVQREWLRFVLQRSRFFSALVRPLLWLLALPAALPLP